LAATLVLVVAVAGVLGLWWTSSRRPGTPPTLAAGAETTAGQPPGLEAGATPEFQRLKGRWQRPDGGYIVEVKSVDDSGHMDAAYFNPRPINVSKAVALREGGVTKVFIELRDVNYPGSTYTLAYDPASDRLAGIYYQALEGHSFEVLFDRLK
jgi:hypothetical protein